MHLNIMTSSDNHVTIIWQPFDHHVTNSIAIEVGLLTGFSLCCSALGEVIQTVPSRDGARVRRALTEEVETLGGDDHFHSLSRGHTLVE